MVELEQNLGDLNGQNGFALVGLDRGDRVGFSVSILGDINGDGIDDAAFGAIDDGASGAAHAIFGQRGNFPTTLLPSQLNGTNGFTLRRSQSVGRLGFSISGAGDINGDGIADLIVGAPAANPKGEFDISGESYAIFGRQDGAFPALVDVDLLDGRTGFSIAGAVGDSAGHSVSGAGDINSDGISDFIVGAPGDNRAYSIYGRVGQQPSAIDLNALTSSQGVVFTGTTDDFAGTTVRNIGDFNGDGFDDVAIAAPLSRRSGTAVEQQARQEGKVYVVFGGASLPAAIDLTQLDGQNGFAFQGNGNGSSLVGSSVDGAGDFNGDGLADLIIGARGAVNQGGGQAYVLYGQRSPLPGLIDRDILNGQTGLTLNGTPDPSGFFSRGEQAGAAVSGIGDYNQDGLDDVLVYAPQGDANGRSDVGRSYVVYGQQNAAPVLDLGTLSQANGFVINGIADFDGDGLQLVQQDGVSGRVDGGGDLNGDRVPDLSIGNPVADRTPLAASSGFGYAVFSSATFNPSSSISQDPSSPSNPDFILGTSGDDLLQGGAGNDAISGNLGADSLNGNGGNDTIFGGQQNDTIDGGSGDDIILAGKDGDIANGGIGNDIVAGNIGSDTLSGGEGDDTLLGGQNGDSIDGGGGADFISGDLGNDTLTGGTGADTFSFRTGDGFDLITDFTVGEDKLSVLEIVTDGGTIGNIGGARLGRLRPVSFAELAIATDGTNSTVSFNGEPIATLNDITRLSAGDFV